MVEEVSIYRFLYYNISKPPKYLNTEVLKLHEVERRIQIQDSDLSVPDAHLTKKPLEPKKLWRLGETNCKGISRTQRCSHNRLYHPLQRRKLVLLFHPNLFHDISASSFQAILSCWSSTIFDSPYFVAVTCALQHPCFSYFFTFSTSS